MERRREGRNDLSGMGDFFGGFGGFGSFGFNRNMTMPSLFGGRDPFDDPFFTRPFGSMFETSSFGPSAKRSGAVETVESKGVVIEELDSDDERAMEEGNGSQKDDKSNIHSGSNKEPSIEHPDDDDDDHDNDNAAANEGMRKKVNKKIQYNKVEGAQPQTRNSSYQTCKVTYGGVDGAYYTSTRTRRTGSDGAILEESKEADRTIGQATHRISRGIHDKGHSVTRKLDSDGKVDTSQILHNLNEDELAGFNEDWKGNAKKHMPNWRDEFDKQGNASSSADEQKGRPNWGGQLLPSLNHGRNFRGLMSDDRARSSASRERTRKVVRINVE